MHSNLGEIYDLQWSPESDFLIAGSIDTKGEILRIDSRDTLVLAGHGNYVQGVCWDPLNEYVGTQSADRSVKLYRIKQPKPQKDKEVAPSMVKLSTKGQVVIKMIPLSGPGDAVGAASTDIDAMDVMPDGPPVPAKGQNLFASATESCFFRRPAFSPDGALLVTPMGLFKTSAANPLVAGIDPPSPSYCTHVFSRASFFQPNAISGNTVMPIYSLTGKEEPSVAVRFNPRLFTNMVSPAADAEDSSVLRGKYRMVFAAVTTSSVFIYDTQHHYPIVTVSGIHYATINDATWSADGSLLIVCSSDGYVTFIKFPSGELGDLLPDDQVPTCVKASHPCIYKYTKPTAQVAVASITDSTTAVTTAVDAAGTTDLAPSSGGSIPSGVEPMETEGETKSVMNTVAELAVTTAKVVPDSSLSTNVFNMDKDTAVQSSSPLVGNSTE